MFAEMCFEGFADGSDETGMGGVVGVGLWVAGFLG